MKDQLNPTNPILIVDDEDMILLAMDTTLQMAGYNNIITCQDPRDALKYFEDKKIELMLSDLNMPYINGEELLAKVHDEHPEIPIIVVTGAVEVETAVRCMKAGAFDYIVKPIEEDRLITTVGRALEYRELKRENQSLKQHILTDQIERIEAFEGIITNNKKMLSVFQYVESIAHTSQPVLITGETGTGKELFANVIHRLSDRTGKFVAVNAAGLDDNVFSDTLFGHTRGAFTGADQERPGLIEQAKGGTLFLDEIGDLSHASQVKLLRLLQESEYLPLGSDRPKQTDARIVVATNVDLWRLQKEGTFRKDLIYRLRTHHVEIPPLRERLDDIPLLVDHFLDYAIKDLNKKKPTPPKELYTLLSNYSFPGNIRSLQAMVFDAVSRHKSRILSLNVFKDHMDAERGDVPAPMHEMNGDALISFSKKLPTINQATSILIEEAMRRANGTQSIAARLLGISHQALSKRLKNIKQKG